MPNSVAVVDLQAPSNGIVTNVSRFDAPPSTAQDIQNMDVDQREGALLTRNGWVKLCDVPVPGGVEPRFMPIHFKTGAIEEIYITKNDGTVVKMLVGVFAYRVTSLVPDPEPPVEKFPLDPAGPDGPGDDPPFGMDGDESFICYVAYKEEQDDTFTFLGNVMDPLLGTPGVISASIAVVDGQARIAISIEQVQPGGTTLHHSPVQWLGWIDRDYFGNRYVPDSRGVYLQEASPVSASTYMSLESSLWLQANPIGHLPDEPGTADLNWVTQVRWPVPPGNWRYASCYVYGSQYGPLDPIGESAGGVNVPAIERVLLTESQRESRGSLCRINLKHEDDFDRSRRATGVAVFRAPENEPGLSGYRLVQQVSIVDGLGDYVDLTIIGGNTALHENGLLEAGTFVVFPSGEYSIGNPDSPASFFATANRSRISGGGEAGIPFYFLGTVIGEKGAMHAYPITYIGCGHHESRATSGTWFQDSQIYIGVGDSRLDSSLLAKVNKNYPLFDSYVLEWRDGVQDQAVLSRVFKEEDGTRYTYLTFGTEFPEGQLSTFTTTYTEHIAWVDGAPNGSVESPLMTEAWAVTVFDEPLEGEAGLWHVKFESTGTLMPAPGDTVRFYRRITRTGIAGAAYKGLSFISFSSPIFSGLISPAVNGVWGDLVVEIGGQELTISRPRFVRSTDGYSVVFSQYDDSRLGAWPDSPVGGRLTSGAPSWELFSDYVHQITFPDYTTDLNSSPRWVDLAGANVINPSIDSSLVAHAGGRLFYGNVTVPPQAPGDEPERFAGTVAYSSVGSDGFVVPDIVDPMNVLTNVLDGSEITGLAGRGDRVIVWTRNSVYRINVGTGYPGTWAVEHNVRGAGCVSPETVADTPFGWIYLSLTGVRVYDSSSATVISSSIHDKLQKDIAAGGKTAFAAYDPSRQAYVLHVNGRIWTAIMPGPGSEGVRWSRYTRPGEEFYMMGSLSDGGIVGAAKPPSPGANTPEIVSMSLDSASDQGEAFESKVVTQDVQVGGPGAATMVQYVFADVACESVTVSVFLDAGTTANRSVVRTGGSEDVVRRVLVPINLPAFTVRVEVTSKPGARMVLEKTGAQVVGLPAGLAAYSGRNMSYYDGG